MIEIIQRKPPDVAAFFTIGKVIADDYNTTINSLLPLIACLFSI